MRVLFFCNTSAYTESNNIGHVQTAPWVDALLEVLAEEKEIKMGLAFQCQNADLKSYQKLGLHYFPVSTELSSPIKKWWYKYSEAIHIPNEEKKFKAILAEFRPDIICVFGTEFSFANIARYTQVPVVLHIQSLVSAYLEHWYSPPVTEKLVKKYCNKWLYLKGAGVLHAYNRFVKQGKRELTFFNTIGYFMGRTAWDKNELLKRASHATYFHIEEVMRPVFYTKVFQVRQKAARIFTAINPNVYKGIDFIFEICKELELRGSTNLEWRIAGISKNDEVIKIARAAAAFLPTTLQPVFLGSCSAAQLVEELNAADCYVHVSAIENSSNSICEAMLMGLPVIALATGGTATIIEHGRTGILVETRKASVFSAEVLTLLENFERRVELSNNAQKKARQRHDRKQIAVNIKDVFTKIISKNAK